MILSTVQMAACVALISAAVYWRIRHDSSTGSHRFLFPFILVAGIAGVLHLSLFAMEAFVIYYTGAIYIYRVLHFASALLPLLPAAGILPQIGKRPLWVAGLGFLALIPAVVSFMIG